MDVRDVMQQFLHLAREHNYIFWIRQDEQTSVMTQAFMEHPRSADILRTYSHVVGMDATYKTNKYNITSGKIRKGCGQSSPKDCVFGQHPFNRKEGLRFLTAALLTEKGCGFSPKPLPFWTQIFFFIVIAMFL